MTDETTTLPEFIREALHLIPSGVGALILEHTDIATIRDSLTRAGDEISTKDSVVAHLERRLEAEGKNVSSLAARVVELEGLLRRYQGHLIDCEGFDFLKASSPGSPLLDGDAESIRAICTQEGEE